jgi:hypothetical protein
MSFIDNIFKKKPGGTFVGNLIRTSASTLTGGLIGAGLNRIEVGQTKTNATLASEAAGTAAATGQLPNEAAIRLALQRQQAGIAENVQNAGNNLIKTTLSAWLKKNWWMVALPGGLLVGLIYWAARGGKKKPTRRY